jgi:hypothetical protein
MSKERDALIHYDSADWWADHQPTSNSSDHPTTGENANTPPQLSNDAKDTIARAVEVDPGSRRAPCVVWIRDRV